MPDHLTDHRAPTRDAHSTRGATKRERDVDTAKLKAGGALRQAGGATLDPLPAPWRVGARLRDA